jgi:hypothetical protein
MQRATVLVLLAGLGLAAATEVTPIQKVLTLMNEMKGKAIKERPMAQDPYTLSHCILAWRSNGSHNPWEHLAHYQSPQAPI